MNAGILEFWISLVLHCITVSKSLHLKYLLLYLLFCCCKQSCLGFYNNVSTSTYSPFTLLMWRSLPWSKTSMMSQCLQEEAGPVSIIPTFLHIKQSLSSAVLLMCTELESHCMIYCFQNFSQSISPHVLIHFVLSA